MTLEIIKEELALMSTEHLKIALIHLYNGLTKDTHGAYRAAMIALEDRVSEEDLNHFLDGLSLGEFGTTCQ